MAQVGAILILAKPENKDQLIFFRGMERVRFRGSVHPGDVVVMITHYATGNTDFLDSPWGHIPGGYILLSSINSVLRGEWTGLVLRNTDMLTVQNADPAEREPREHLQCSLRRERPAPCGR